jgi:hypothetical protein
MAANSALKEFYLQLVNTRTKRPVDDDAGSYQVYQPGSPTRQTIRDAAGTTLTQAVQFGNFVSRTMTDGIINFFTAQTVTSVDISILTNGGRSYFLKGVAPSQKRVDVTPEDSRYTLIVGINDSASSTALRSTGFTLRKGMIIDDVFVKVTTAYAGAATGNNSINIGIAGDSDAFVKLMNVTATGYKQIRVHSSTGKIFATQFAGVQLADWDTSSGQTVMGWFTRKKYFTPTATVLSFARAVTLTGSMTGTNAKGKGYLFVTYSLDPTVTTAL